MTASDLTALHRKLKKQEPSLVNRAGKSYLKLLAAETMWTDQPAASSSGREKVPHTQRHISVRGIRRAEVDFVKLAKVLLDIAKSQAEAAGPEGDGQESNVA